MPGTEYRVLHDNVTVNLMEALATVHPEEDSSLSDRFLKFMDASTKSLFVAVEKLSGYRIFKSIEDFASTQKSDAEIKLLYIQWISIKRTTAESIRAFATRVQTDAAQFDGTDYEVNSKALVRRWRKGLGSDLRPIKKMVDETGIIPDVCSEKLPLRQLVDKSESYLRARGVKDSDDKKKDEEKQDGRKTRQIETHKEPYLQGDGRKKRPPDGPPNFTHHQPEPEVYNWQKYVKRHIFQHEFITDQHLKTSLQFAGKFPSGFYYCWMYNHNHQQCGK